MSFRYCGVLIRSWTPVPDCERLIGKRGMVQTDVGSLPEIDALADWVKAELNSGCCLAVVHLGIEIGAERLSRPGGGKNAA
jgi:hypothetical protein